MYIQIICGNMYQMQSFLWNYLYVDIFISNYIFMQVVEEVKKMIEVSSNQKFVVYEFKVDVNVKVIEKCINVV